MNNKRNLKNVVDLGDDATIEGLANYGAGQNGVIDPEDDKHYYFAAKDHSDNRPDSVRACEARGYKVSEKKSFGSQDCVLMEIPREIYEKRQQKQVEENRRQLIESMRLNKRRGDEDDDGLQRLPGYTHSLKGV